MQMSAIIQGSVHGSHLGERKRRPREDEPASQGRAAGPAQDGNNNPELPSTCHSPGRPAQGGLSLRPPSHPPISLLPRMDLPSTTTVSIVQSRSRTGESARPTDPWGGRGHGAGSHDPKGIILSGSRTSSPFPAPRLVFPVAASKSGLSRAPSRKKKNRKGPVIQITEMSEKFLSQESEASE